MKFSRMISLISNWGKSSVLKCQDIENKLLNKVFYLAQISHKNTIFFTYCSLSYYLVMMRNNIRSVDGKKLLTI
jgi:hypothetical protein